VITVHACLSLSKRDKSRSELPSPPGYMHDPPKEEVRQYYICCSNISVSNYTLVPFFFFVVVVKESTESADPSLVAKVRSYAS